MEKLREALLGLWIVLNLALTVGKKHRASPTFEEGSMAPRFSRAWRPQEC